MTNFTKEWKAESTQLICEHCGHTGDDVVRRFDYIGGKGETEVYECEDRLACWERWNKAHLCPICSQPARKPPKEPVICPACGKVV